jgi:hypothetical protein
MSIEVDEENPSYSSMDGVLFNKDKTELISCPNGMQVSYTIPNGVTSICDNAFRYSKLISVTIPKSVTSIGKYAFFACEKLTIVMFENASGWCYMEDASATDGTSISSKDLSIVTKAAEYLANTYTLCYWKRSEEQ